MTLLSCSLRLVLNTLGSVLGQPWTNILPSIVNDMITPVDYGENMVL